MVEFPINEWTVFPPPDDTPTDQMPRFATEPEAQAYAAEHGGIAVGLVHVMEVTVCGERGQSIASADNIVNDRHAESCSLHPDQRRLTSRNAGSSRRPPVADRPARMRQINPGQRFRFLLQRS